MFTLLQRSRIYVMISKRCDISIHPCPDSGITFFNTLTPRQNGRHFADDTFKRIFLNENVRISIKISLKFVPKDEINNIPALVKIMVWRRSGDKPLSEPMMIRLTTHICVTRPQWVNHGWYESMWLIPTHGTESYTFWLIFSLNQRCVCCLRRTSFFSSPADTSFGGLQTDNYLVSTS